MNYRSTRQVCAAVAIGLALCAGQFRPAHANDVEDFYRGKTISMVIGYSVGGGYDVYARMLARYMGQHIPGKPSIVPRNMPGAASQRAANFVSSVAPKDGTVIGTFSRTLAVAPVYSPDTAFDGTKLVWLGSVVSDGTQLCITGGKSPIRTWNDMLTKPMTMGVPAAGTQPDIFARLYKNLFGAPIRIVAGYPGTNEVTLAMERREVEGQCGVTLSTLRAAHPNMLTDKTINLIVQAGLAKHPGLPQVPLARDLTEDAVKKQILDLIMLPEGMARPFATTPGIPVDRRAALVKAFNDTMRDPEFLAATAKAKMDVSPVTATEIEALLKQLYAIPADVVALAAKAISE